MQKNNADLGNKIIRIHLEIPRPDEILKIDFDINIKEDNIDKIMSELNDVLELTESEKKTTKAEIERQINAHLINNENQELDLAYKLHITIYEAKNLLQMDIDDNSQPYVTLKLQSQNNMLKTNKLFGTNPTWNQEFDIDVKDPNDILLINMYSDDILDIDLMMDEIKIPLGDQKNISHYIFNDNIKLKEKDAGTLHFEIVIQHMNQEKNTQKKSSSLSESKMKIIHQKEPILDDVVIKKEQYDRLVKHLRYVENHLYQYEQVKPFDFEKFEGEEGNVEDENIKTDLDITHEDKENFFIDEEDEKNHVIIKKLGEGASSIAYKIIDKRTSQVMCKKVIKFEEGKTSIKTAQNSMKEFEVLHSINHPCICHSIGINTQEPVSNEEDKTEEEDDSDDDDDVLSIRKKGDMTTIALFLELLEIKLKDCLSSNIFSNTMKVKVVVEVAFAMDFIHKLGMIHRDLKIENIMLNSGLEAKVIDFDLVHVTENVVDNTNLSMTKGIGTLAYMSPEMQNEDEYNNKTDVYSFGIVLHVIFTGKILKQKMNEKLGGVKPKLPKPSASISKECIDLIGRCLDFKPSDRPSFEEILDFMEKEKFALAPEVEYEIISRRYNTLKRFNEIHIKSFQNK